MKVSRYSTFALVPGVLAALTCCTMMGPKFHEKTNWATEDIPIRGVSKQYHVTVVNIKESEVYLKVADGGTQRLKKGDWVEDTIPMYSVRVKDVLPKEKVMLEYVESVEFGVSRD